MKLIFPPTLSQYSDINGNVYTPDTNGMLDIGSNLPAPFLADGFMQLPDTAVTTANRPTTGLAPGLMLFDITLNLPIWRNTANTAWINAAGATV